MGKDLAYQQVKYIYIEKYYRKTPSLPLLTLLSFKGEIPFTHTKKLCLSLHIILVSDSKVMQIIY